MPVSDFECQIARGQIGRYLDGATLSSEALAGLEEHLDDCPGCRDLVAQRRAALLGALGGEAPTRAVVSMSVENPLVAALRAKAEADTEPVATASRSVPMAKPQPRYAKPEPKGGMGKPLTLAALLAVVLVGMSRLSHVATAPTSRAAASFASEALPEPTAKPVEKASLSPEEGNEAKAPRPIAATSPGPFVAIGKSAPMGKGPVPDVRETPTVPKAPAIAKPKVQASPLPKTAPKVIARPKTKAQPREARPITGVARRRSIRLRRGRPLVRRTVLKPKVRTTVRVYGLDGHPLQP